MSLIVEAPPKEWQARLVSPRFIYAAPADPRVRRDRWIGFLTALVLHTILFYGAGSTFFQQSRFGVDAGSGGIEIHLVAAPAAAETLPAIEPQAASSPKPVPAAQVPPAPAKTKEISGDGSSPEPGKDKTTFHSAAGAHAIARPHYLKNPPPRYPALSRQNGEEGLVMLEVDVSRDGLARAVELGRSSGYPLLDEAALEAVKRWRFQPARLGPLPVDSIVQVPVRFRLNER